MAIFNREHEPPEPPDSDVAYDVAKAAIGAVVPGAGLAIAATDLVLKHVFGVPFARRQREWMDEIAESLRRLENERVA